MARGKIIVLCTMLLACATVGCKKKSEPTVEPPVKVKAEVIGSSTGSGEHTRIYSGTVAASTTTMLSFSAGGTITRLTAEEGSGVAKGQLLGQVSSGDYENANNITQAQLTEARDAYERLKKLHDADALPEIKWVEVQQKLKQAENAAQMSARTLSDASLISPVAGKVSRKLANVGQNVAPGEPVYEIVSSGELTIDISVPEEEIGAFTIGEKARVTFDRMPGVSLEGQVSSKGVAADPLTRGFTVKISLPANSEILPGMTGTVAIEQSESAEAPKEAFIVPPQAVLLDSDNTMFVWVVKNGRAERRFVEANEFIEKGVEITRGLSRGDTVITEGIRKVGTGTPVTIDGN